MLNGSFKWKMQTGFTIKNIKFQGVIYGRKRNKCMERL